MVLKYNESKQNKIDPIEIDPVRKREIEDIAFFHDQKSPGAFMPDGRLSKDSIHRGFWDEQRQRESKEVKEKQVLEIKIIKDAVYKIINAKLEPLAIGDAEQENLLIKRKEIAKKMLKDLFDAIINYYNYVQSNVIAQRQAVSAEIDKDIAMNLLIQSEEDRKIKHDSLISNLQSAIRFIVHTFGKVSESALEKWEETLEKRGEPLLYVERQDFLKNVICPDDINIRDRYNIAEWAWRVFEALPYLEEELK